MYQVDRDRRKLMKLNQVNFSDIYVKESFDIEEWIKNDPDVLKEDLLIIGEQEYLPSGRKPDLIALDKEGNLVIIELKRDDTGKDVYWQAITYAAQLSELDPNDLMNQFENYLEKINSEEKNAKEMIDEFIEEDFDKINSKQRIILVSKEFHQDVLKASKWLSEEYTVDLKCIRLIPYEDDNNNLFINSEILLPTPGLESYIEKKSRKRKTYSEKTFLSTFSKEKGNYENEILEKKVKKTLSLNTIQTPRLLEFIKILYEKNAECSREEIKEEFFNRGIGENIGHAGRLLSNISSFLTKKSTPHLRQIIGFTGGGESGSQKDNYHIIPKYRDLVGKILSDIENV